MDRLMFLVTLSPLKANYFTFLVISIYYDTITRVPSLGARKRIKFIAADDNHCEPNLHSNDIENRAYFVTHGYMIFRFRIFFMVQECTFRFFFINLCCLRLQFTHDGKNELVCCDLDTFKLYY